MSTAPTISNVPNLTEGGLAEDDRIMSIRDESTGRTVQVSLAELRAFFFAASNFTGDNNELMLEVYNILNDGSAEFNNTVNLNGLETSDPGVPGRLWNNGGVVTVSAG